MCCFRQIGLMCLVLLTLHANALEVQPPWIVKHMRPPLPLDPDLPQPENFPFALAAPFGSVTLPAADCCPYANFPLPLPSLPQRPRMVFVLGFPKAGTTALYQLLRLHPKIAAWRRKGVTTTNELDKLFLDKEAHFMARPADISYADVEEYMSGWNSAPADSLWMEATPDYVHLPIVACRIKAAFPDARLIISVRDPVLRTMSQYQHQGRMEWNVNITQAPFGRRIRRELDLLLRKGCMFEEPNPNATWNKCFKCYMSELCQPWSTMWHGRDQLCDQLCAPNKRCDEASWMVMKGMYAPIIANWLRLFPAEQIFVVNMKDQINQLPEILKFLDLPPMSLSGDATHAALDKIRAHSALQFGAGVCARLNQVDPAARKQLKEFYDRQNRVLYQLMNKMGLKFTRFPKTCSVTPVQA